MNNEDLQKLKEVALAATPGPWEYREAEGMGAICHAGGWIMDDLSEQALRDTEHCATANPSAILALIAEVEQARTAKQEQEPAAWIIKYPDGVVIPIVGKTVPKAYAGYATPLFAAPQ